MSFQTMGFDTLLIKHLPPELTNSKKVDLLKHFGAVEVKCLSSKRNKYNIVFARFNNERVAENVLHRLHQLEVMGSHLSVEYAKNKHLNDLTAPDKIELKRKGENEELTGNEKFYKKFIDKLNSWHSGVDFQQPVPTHLKYQYPPPNTQVLINIIKVLATVPKFYNQVLHLMNKMNLPCPFNKELLPFFDLGIHKTISTTETVENVIPEQNVPSETESEISSDEETKKHKEIIPKQLKHKKKKVIKVPKFVKPSSQAPAKKHKRTVFEEVFETVLENESNAKKVKLSYPSLEELPKFQGAEKVKEKVSATESSPGGFGFIHPISKPKETEEIVDTRDEREEERLQREKINCITSEELAANRISEKDRTVLPVFKNYAEGAPTCRLYVKNVTKTVTDEDLRFIYSKYISHSIDDEPNTFDIRLMQEGRMKGQAFVTLQNIHLARQALDETNGYILKDKPLVVQFARSASK